jgi:multidrug efflux pump subunit AcrA (membrane-fusion protein)
LDGQQVRLRRLTTGARRDGMVEVLDGLSTGERVVRTGAGFLADGDHVRVIPAAE